MENKVEWKRFSGSMSYAKAPIVVAEDHESAVPKMIAKMRKMFETMTDEQISEEIIIIPRQVSAERIYPDTIDEVITLLEAVMITDNGITFDYEDFEFIPRNPDSANKIMAFLTLHGAPDIEATSTNSEDPNEKFMTLMDDDDDAVILKDNFAVYELKTLLENECEIHAGGEFTVSLIPRPEEQ